MRLVMLAQSSTSRLRSAESEAFRRTPTAIWQVSFRHPSTVTMTSAYSLPLALSTTPATRRLERFPERHPLQPASPR